MEEYNVDDKLHTVHRRAMQNSHLSNLAMRKIEFMKKYQLGNSIDMINVMAAYNTKRYKINYNVNVEAEIARLADEFARADI